MEKRSYKTHSTYNSGKSGCEKNTGISVTVPGQSYTVAELLKKHVQGNMPDIKRQDYYDPDASLDNIDPTQLPDFDLSDATELADKTKKKIEDQEALAKEKAEKAAKKEIDEKNEVAIRDRVKKELEDEERSKKDVKNNKDDPDSD